MPKGTEATPSSSDNEPEQELITATTTSSEQQQTPNQKPSIFQHVQTRGKNPMTSTPAAEQEIIDDDDSEAEDGEPEGILEYVTDNNDRFANIIERMDMLERENELLRQQKEEADTRDRKHIYDTYEQEIAESRRLLDEIAGDKAQKDIEASRLADQVKELGTEKEKLAAAIV